MKFENEKKLLNLIKAGNDLYCPEKQLYVFFINGKVCVHEDISVDDAKELAIATALTGDNWSALIGNNGDYYDPLEWCKSNYQFDWEDTKDYFIK